MSVCVWWVSAALIVMSYIPSPAAFALLLSVIFTLSFIYALSLSSFIPSSRCKPWFHHWLTHEEVHTNPASHTPSTTYSVHLPPLTLLSNSPCFFFVPFSQEKQEHQTEAGHPQGKPEKRLKAPSLVADKENRLYKSYKTTSLMWFY